jgi:hypothetical protein
MPTRALQVHLTGEGENGVRVRATVGSDKGDFGCVCTASALAPPELARHGASAAERLRLAAGLRMQRLLV